MLESALYIVPTPIGNLNDITLRALEVLRAATLIAAEDTRHTRTLLDHFGVGSVRMISCHDHNEESRVDIIAAEVGQGGIVALVSDAGTPLISDPGFKVVRALHERGVKVVPLPGPCAAITALEAGGLPTDRFLFAGFLPVKEAELTAVISSLASCGHTTVFYEAPHRLLRTLSLMAELIPEQELAVCKELTKTFERVFHLKAREAPAFMQAEPERLKGEFVLIVGPAPQREEEIPAAVQEALAALIAHAPVKLVCQQLSALCGINKNDLYKLALSLK